MGKKTNTLQRRGPAEAMPAGAVLATMGLFSQSTTAAARSSGVVAVFGVSAPVDEDGECESADEELEPCEGLGVDMLTWCAFRGRVCSRPAWGCWRDHKAGSKIGEHD